MPLTFDEASTLRRNIEFYFSDINLSRDVFLKNKVAEDPNGFVPLSVLLTFGRVSKLTKDAKELFDAIKDSETLVLDEQNLSVARKEPMHPAK